MSMAIRNRAIKKTLEAAFGRGKITVRGSRGTGYGYVHAHVDWTPLDVERASRMRGVQCPAASRQDRSGTRLHGRYLPV